MKPFTVEEAVAFCERFELDVEFKRIDRFCIRPRVIIRPNAWSQYEGKNLVEAVQKFYHGFYGVAERPQDETGWKPD